MYLYHNVKGMSKTSKYVLASILLGLVYLTLALMIPMRFNTQFYCGVADVQPNYGWCVTATQDLSSAGTKLFKANCASCHKLNARLIGPALVGVEQRWVDAGEYKGVDGREWLKRYIRNWNDPVEAGHPYAMKIIEYDASAMTTFPNLSMDDVDSLLLHINSYEPQPHTEPVVYD